MKKKLLVLLLILFSVKFYAQVNFEKAYFIDNNGNKTECFIKNRDKYNTPSDFEYKLSMEDSKVFIGDLKKIKEFKIGEALKYERASVKIDTSKTTLNTPSTKRDSEWKEMTVFLKVLVESKASLYEYKNGNIRKYFYKTETIALEPLIFKKYLDEEFYGNKLVSNNDFQKQLWTNVKCGNKSIDDLMKLKYERKDLTNYFKEYNNCKNNKMTDFEVKSAVGSYNLKIKAGINSSSLSISNHESLIIDADFGNKISPNFGAEFEYVMPFNRNKWALYLSPNYNSYKGEARTVIHRNNGVLLPNDIIYNWQVSFSHIDIPVGLRYYMFLNDNSKIFINAAYVIPILLNSDIHDDSSFNLDSKFGSSVTYGVGYSYKNKFSVELRQNSPNIFSNYVYWNSNYNVTSLVFGYTIFNNLKKNK